MKLTKSKLKEIIREELLKEDDGLTEMKQLYLDAYIKVNKSLVNLMTIKAKWKVIHSIVNINKLVSSLKKTLKDIEKEWEGVHEFKPKYRGPCYTNKFEGSHPPTIESSLSNLKQKFDYQLKEIAHENI